MQIILVYLYFDYFDHKIYQWLQYGGGGGRRGGNRSSPEKSEWN